MKYAVDQIIDKIVIIENIDTKEKKKVFKGNLPKKIREGTVLKEEEGIYTIDYKEERKRRKLLEEKLKVVKEIGETK